MSRFDVIEKEINKGVKIDEKSNVVIQGWSPNNVRRLIIGVDYVVVQYYVKTGKYSKLVEIVPLGKNTKEDYDNLIENNKYTPILKVLTANRIISSIEEVVFCLKNYPKELRVKDTELGVLGKDNNLSNRFVRLNNVSATPLSVQEVMPFIKESMSGDKLLIDALKDGGIQVKPFLELHKEDWIYGTNLRSRWYAMDKEGSVLHTYFTKLKESKDLEDRENRLRDIEIKKHETLAKGKLKSVLILIDTVLGVEKETTEIVEGLSIVDKLEWGNSIRVDKIHNNCRKSLATIPPNAEEGYEPLSNLLRRVDIEGLNDLVVAYGVGSETTLLDFDDFSKRLLQYNDNYKRESNKASIVDSVDILQKGVVKLLNALLNSLYLALIQYCSKAGVDNVSYYVEELSLDTTMLNYTRPLVEYCNKDIKNNNSGEILKAMGCNLVEVEAMGMEYKVKTIKYILSKLKIA